MEPPPTAHQQQDRATHPVVRSLLPHLFMVGRPISSAIYGTVSVVAVIVVGAHGVTSATLVLVFAAVSMAVIWAVHVYASVMAFAGAEAVHWRAAVKRAVSHETGLLEGATLPLLVLATGAVGLLDDSTAITAAVWCGVLVLTLLPTVWLRAQGAAWRRCIAASAVSGLLGLLLVVLKIVVH
ncbi:MAG TPA: hypothetical protein VFX41_05075 [Actinomycetales bacterium]|jgi:hypothetical protein|nr:hypothetical protein [Actinomycetales bacterium]